MGILKSGARMKRYRTAAGSSVEISGQHDGISVIEFDWFEERACIEAHPTCDIADEDDAWLHWWCECCCPGSAKLVREGQVDE